jgi:transketolase C-terminal domain/subunit
LDVEVNNILGGLGGAVREILAETGNLNIKFKRMGFNDIYPSKRAYREYLEKIYGFSKDDIIKTINSMF